MTREAKIRFKNAADVKLVRKAAKAEDRSVSQFVTLAAIDRAKATLAMTKFPPVSASSQEASA